MKRTIKKTLNIILSILLVVCAIMFFKSIAEDTASKKDYDEAHKLAGDLDVEETEESTIYEISIPPDQEQEPTQSQRGVHIAPERVDTKDAHMQERLAYHLPYSHDGTACQYVASHNSLIGARQSHKPQCPLEGYCCEHEYCARNKRYGKWGIECHN